MKSSEKITLLGWAAGACASAGVVSDATIRTEQIEAEAHCPRIGSPFLVSRAARRFIAMLPPDRRHDNALSIILSQTHLRQPPDPSVP